MRFCFHAGIRAALLAILVAPAAAGADSAGQDEARRAVEAGEIRPLTDILKIVGPKLPGEIVRVEIERKDRLLVYEFKVVDRKGRLFDVHVDARTGEIRRVKEK